MVGRRRQSPRKESRRRLAPCDIRRRPLLAFGLFDINDDGFFSLSRLLDANTLDALGVTGDSVVDRSEFCAVVSDFRLCNDVAVDSISRLCEEERRRSSGAVLDGDREEEHIYHTTTAALGVIQGLKKYRSLEQEVYFDESIYEGHRYDLSLDLYALRRDFESGNDALFHLFFGTRAKAEVWGAGQLIASACNDSRQGSITKWTVEISSRQLANVGLRPTEPFKLHVVLYDVDFVNGSECIGVSPPFDVARINTTSPTDRAVIGPYPAKHPKNDKLRANILGTRRWISADCEDYDHAIDPS